MYLYSVIIPHRSSINTLERAVNSIPNRSDIEVIIIDNSQPSLTINELQNVNRTFNLIYSDPIRGAGGARNIGISKANGRYLLFLDADDFFNKNAFEIFDKWKYLNSDIVFFNVNSVFSDTLLPSNRARYTNYLFEKFAKNSDEDEFKYNYVTPWCKMFRNDFISNNNIVFDEIEVDNDTMFSLKAAYLAKTIQYDDSIPYCVTITYGSLVNKISKERNRIRYLVAIKRYHFMIEIGKSKYRPRMQSLIFKSLRFGIREFFWYVITARKNAISLFWGGDLFVMSIIRKTVFKIDV